MTAADVPHCTACGGLITLTPMRRWVHMDAAKRTTDHLVVPSAAADSALRAAMVANRERLS